MLWKPHTNNHTIEDFEKKTKTKTKFFKFKFKNLKYLCCNISFAKRVPSPNREYLLSFHPRTLRFKQICCLFMEIKAALANSLNL